LSLDNIATDGIDIYSDNTLFYNVDASGRRTAHTGLPVRFPSHAASTWTTPFGRWRLVPRQNLRLGKELVNVKLTFEMTGGKRATTKSGK
jgi:hypothetical protein